MRSPVHGDASMELAHQLIAALLNIDNGTDASPILTVLNTANSLIGPGIILPGISPASDLGQQMEDAATTLDEFNKRGHDRRLRRND